MTYKIRVRKLPERDYENWKNSCELNDNCGYLYAILDQFEDVYKMSARFKKRADILDIKVTFIPFDCKGDVMISFYTDRYELEEILYDPFTFDKNTVYRKPDKPEYLEEVKATDCTIYKIATHPIGKFIDLIGVENKEETKHIFHQPNFKTMELYPFCGHSENDDRITEGVKFFNKMKDLLNADGMIISYGLEKFEFRSGDYRHSYIVLIYTDKPYDEVVETFKKYLRKIEEEKIKEVNKNKVLVRFVNYVSYGDKKIYSKDEIEITTQKPDEYFLELQKYLQKQFKWYSGQGEQPISYFYTELRAETTDENLRIITIVVYPGKNDNWHLQQYNEQVIQNFLKYMEGNS